MPVLPFHKNSYNVNQIIFLNYGPYEYEYFSKCTFYVVTHVSHTNQIVYINSYSTHPYQAIKISLFTTPQWSHPDLIRVCTICHTAHISNEHVIGPVYNTTMTGHTNHIYMGYLVSLRCHDDPILGQKSMYKQHRPSLSGSTLFAIPIIFKYLYKFYD